MNSSLVVLLSIIAIIYMIVHMIAIYIRYINSANVMIKLQEELKHTISIGFETARSQLIIDTVNYVYEDQYSLDLKDCLEKIIPKLFVSNFSITFTRAFIKSSPLMDHNIQNVCDLLVARFNCKVKLEQTLSRKFQSPNGTYEKIWIITLSDIQYPPYIERNVLELLTYERLFNDLQSKQE